jgi:hypothetical protein
MKTQIVGKIQSVTINLNRTEPTSYISISENVVSGGEIELILGFENKGNVSQTVTMLPFGNFVKCSKVSGVFFINNVAAPDPEVAVLGINEVGLYKYVIQVDEIPVGDPLTDFSFEADWVWN